MDFGHFFNLKYKPEIIEVITYGIVNSYSSEPYIIKKEAITPKA